METAATLRIDKCLYGVETVFKAAYTFLDRCYLQLSQDEEHYLVALTPKDSLASLPDVEGAFWNALVDQRTRDIVSRESGTVRNLLYAHAFSRVNLVFADRDAEEAWSDPLRIGPREGQSTGFPGAAP